MAYTHYQDGTPDPTTQNGTSAFQSTRTNLDALRDALTVGIMPGWNFQAVAGSGSAAFPQYHYYTKLQERIRLTLTWGTSGGETNNLITMVAEYTSNYQNLTTYPYQNIGECDITYNADSIATLTTWDLT